MDQSFTAKKTALASFLIIGTAWMFDALDVGLLSFIMPIVRKAWGLANSQAGLISSVSTIGMISVAAFTLATSPIASVEKIP